MTHGQTAEFDSMFEADETPSHQSDGQGMGIRETRETCEDVLSGKLHMVEAVSESYVARLLQIDFVFSHYGFIVAMSCNELQ